MHANQHKTHCPKGHPYNRENTYLSFSTRAGKKVRNCRACKLTHDKLTNAALHDEVIKFLGNKCACCGETEHLFLTIEHVLGGGTKHRRLRSGGRMYRDILNDPEALSKYQCLCMNCNYARRYSYCPHELKILKFVEAA